MFKLITASTIKTYYFGDSSELKFAIYALFTGSWLVEGNAFASLLRCTSSFRETLATFITKWSNECPYVKRLNDFFKNVKDDEYFAFVSHQPELPSGDFQSKNLNIQSYRLQLKCLANGIDYKSKIHTTFLTTEGLAITRYNSLYFGYEDEEVRIGEQDKRKRICRYCGCSMPEITFKNKAHAIPEALGNKFLICNEECDECNNRLASVEESLTSHMEYNRVQCRIPNKGGNIPEIEGQDFVVRRDNNGNPQIIVDGSKTALRKNPDGTFSLRINGSKPIFENNIYKTLVKCVIGLLPNEELPYFINTIAWINDKLYDTEYPSVYKAYTKGVNIQPKCKIFLNHKKISHSPYCTALLYTCDMVYMFIVPFVTIDAGLFKYDSDLVQHWSDFFHYFPQKWVRWDLSSIEPKTSYYDKIINPANIKPLTSGKFDSSVFASKRPRSNKLREKVEFPEPDMQNIAKIEISDSHISFSQNLNITEAMKRDVSVKCAPAIQVDPDKSRCIVIFDANIFDTTGTIEYMQCRYRCNIYFKEFTRNIEICDDSFAFDYRLRNMLWTIACNFGEIFFAPQRANTQFASFRISDLADDTQLKENITFILPNGNCCHSNKLYGKVFAK